MIILFLRTKKGLDVVFKLFFVAMLILLIGTLLHLDQYLGIVPADSIEMISDLSRFLAITFFIFGSLKFLDIVSKANK